MPLDATIPVALASTLGEYTHRALIVPELRQRDTAGILGELSQVLRRQGCITDVLPCYQTALNRELLFNSALESGLALPHARLSGVKQLVFALGRTPEPVIWGAKGSWPVQLIFLLAVPATDAACYLNLLASLARLGRQTETLDQLRAADGADAILAVLQRIRMRQE
jgi:mannitol/fructose-specific phosphotransferase system IIA component (Ntr-type)